MGLPLPYPSPGDSLTLARKSFGSLVPSQGTKDCHLAPFWSQLGAKICLQGAKMGKDGPHMPDLCSKMCLMCLKMAPYKHLMADFGSMLTSRNLKKPQKTYKN